MAKPRIRNHLFEWIALFLVLLVVVALLLPALPPRPSKETLRLAKEIRELGGTPVMPFATITYVRFENTAVRDTDLRVLQKLPYLRTLNLENTAVGNAGLGYLHGAEKLEYLYLDGTRVSDEGLKHLAGLKNLRYLSLTRTEITDAAVEHLRCLRSLNTLHLRSTRLTINGILELRAALPNTGITSDYDASLIDPSEGRNDVRGTEGRKE